jgi:hypothetical protein
MTEHTPLPEMRTGLLDEAGVEALFRDIAALANVDEILIKDRPGRIDDTTSPSLDRARHLLQAKEIRGVQIRYRHQGATWWDTLMCDPAGVRLVRIQHEFGDVP